MPIIHWLNKQFKPDQFNINNKMAILYKVDGVITYPDLSEFMNAIRTLHIWTVNMYFCDYRASIWINQNKGIKIADARYLFNPVPDPYLVQFVNIACQNKKPEPHEIEYIINTLCPS